MTKIRRMTRATWRFIKREWWLTCYLVPMSAFQLWLAYDGQPTFTSVLCGFIMGACVALEVMRVWREAFPRFDSSTTLLAALHAQNRRDRKFVGDGPTITSKATFTTDDGETFTVAIITEGSGKKPPVTIDQ